MNWAEIILAVYAAGALLLFALLLVDEARRLGRASWGGAGDALFCSVIWPVIAGLILYEVATRKKGARP